MGILQTRLFLSLLCGHLLGDFYFQLPQMAEGKNRDWRALGRHAAIYAAAVLAVCLPSLSCGAWLWVLLPAAAHAVIDAAKALLCRRCGGRAWLQRYEARGNLFVVDQVLHLAVLAAAAARMRVCSLNRLGLALGEGARTVFGLPGVQILAVITLVLLLGKPANVLLKRCNHAPQGSGTPVPPAGGQVSAGCQSPDYPGAGAIIGTLERLLAALLCAMGQYAAIGLVFAAKTLTRYDRIAKDPPFAEYYLIGTLGSLLLALCATRLLLP